MRANPNIEHATNLNAREKPDILPPLPLATGVAVPTPPVWCSEACIRLNGFDAPAEVALLVDATVALEAVVAGGI